MHALPTEWSALCSLVFLLGMRHGFDADHLAAIDGLTRLTSYHRRTHSRYCGALFSVGHGVVVLAIAAAVGLLSERWVPPAWLDAFGAWVSIVFLLLLGLVNLHAVVRAPSGSVVRLVGIKGRFFGRFAKARRPLGVAGVGALFALSFDTVSQSALFAITATQFGGVAHALVLGWLFLLGMLVTDGVNGWWISRLIARADRIALIASRVISMTVSAVSLLVAAFGIGKLISPSVERWSEGKELAFGVLVVLIVAISYLVAQWIARAPPPEHTTA